jgi:protein-tyrosine phosphatase
MGIFTGKKSAVKDFSVIGTDLHSHVLPGLDDGSPSMEESLKMLEGFAEAGFRKIITTPHVSTAAYPNTRDRILGQLYHLREVAAEKGIPLELEASAEYHLDYEFTERVQTGEVIPFGEKNYLLVELPFLKPGFDFEAVLFRLLVEGYQPVIAHPERYVWMMGRMNYYSRLIERGMLFQVNINSFNGMYGFPIRMAARRLLDAGMISFIGSDAHYLGQVKALTGLLHNHRFARLVESGTLLNATL